MQVAKTTGQDGIQRPYTGWQTVTLPDRWYKRWYDYTGSAWYKIVWDYHCPKDVVSPMTLVINSINMAGQIYVNDELLWQDKSLVEPLSRSWNMPRYWNLSPSNIKQGQNIIWVRVVGVTTQDSGLGHVVLAAPEVAIPQYEIFWLKQRVLNFFNLTFFLTLGTIAFLIWIFRRQEKAFGWFSLTCMIWVVVMTNVSITEPPLGLATLQIARINIVMLFAYSLCSCLYAWRFAQQAFPRIEKTFLVSFLLVALSAILLPDRSLSWFLLLIFMSAILINIVNCISFSFIAHKVKQTESYLLAALFILCLLILLHDAYFILIGTDNHSSLMAYTSPAITLFIAIILALRLAKNMSRIEKFNETLENKIITVKTELNESLSTQHQLELQNTRLQERIHLAHDLHDSLGGALVRSIAIIDQSHNNLSNQQFLSILKLLRDDLRQIIDHGSSNGVKVPESPILWSAPIRHRFDQLFEELDIHSEWYFPEQWEFQPTPLECLTLLRIAEEALTNIIKHSQAQNVSIELCFSEQQLIFKIADDGIGFDVEAVQHAGISVGLRSMQTRLEHLGGKLEIQSETGKTYVKACLSF
nr:ATP-binding protein [Acinetobacter modestus]